MSAEQVAPVSAEQVASVSAEQVAPPNISNPLPSVPFGPGTVVFVQDRTWPGRNDPGGVARISKAHRGANGTMIYDVTYVLESRKEKGVEERFVSLHADHVSQRAAKTNAMTNLMEPEMTVVSASNSSSGMVLQPSLSAGAPTRFPNGVSVVHPQGPLMSAQPVAQLGLLATSQVSGHPRPLLSSLNPTPEEKFPELRDVEFLVASGKVFARHRRSLEPFDPLTLQDDSESKNPDLGSNNSSMVKPQPVNSLTLLKSRPSPPLPLTARQLGALLKLLGPKICMALPWLRIPFSAHKLFATKAKEGAKEGVKEGASPSSKAVVQSPMPRNDAPKLTPASKPNGESITKNPDLEALVAHQKSECEFLSKNSDKNNPMMYSNNYRRAPPVLMVRAHQGGQFLNSQGSYLIPDINNYRECALLEIILVF